jgi:hypothetical protein
MQNVSIHVCLTGLMYRLFNVSMNL